MSTPTLIRKVCFISLWGWDGACVNDLYIPCYVDTKHNRCDARHRQPHSSSTSIEATQYTFHNAKALLLMWVPS